MTDMTVDSDTPDSPKQTRRGMLGALGAAIAGVAAGSLLGKTESAGAADGGNFTLGGPNAATHATSLTTSGTIAGGGALAVTAADSYAAIEGRSASIGVLGNATTGLMGVGDVGGVFSGDLNAINLHPQAFTGDAVPATDEHLTGDVLVDANGVMWLCTAAGQPGTWAPISGGTMQLLGSPQRVYDSRNPGAGGRFAGGSTRAIEVTAAGIGVPANARAIACNLTVTETDDYGFLSAFPAGTDRPLASNVNWAPGATVANSATVRLGAGGRIWVYVERSQAQVIVDVAGYLV